MRLLYAIMIALLVGWPAYAADMNQNNWSEIDSQNNTSPPNGWPTGMLPNQTEATARAGMGANKRFYDHINATVTSTGTANAQILTYAQTPTALVAGDVFRFFVGAGLTNTGATTLTINGLPTAPVQLAGTALTGGELQASRLVTVTYDGSAFQLPSPGKELLGAGNVFGPYGIGNAITSAITDTGNNFNSAVVGEVTNTATTSAVSPSGVIGDAILNSSGDEANGLQSVCTQMTTGVCTNEFDTFNNFTSPSPISAFPLIRTRGTTNTVPVTVTVASAGAYPSAEGIEIGGNGNTYEVGLYEQPATFGACCSTDTIGLWVDADAANGAQIDALFRNPGTGTGVVLQSTNSPTTDFTAALAVEAPATSGNGPGAILGQFSWDGDIVGQAIQNNGHLIDNSPQATISACGSYSGSGSDVSGTIFPGPTVNTCTINFAKAYAFTPNCIVSGVDTGALVVNITGIRSAATLSVGGVTWNGSAWVQTNFSGSNGFSYFCIQ